jgi:polyhydroxyalkanoate synthesis regulator protein
MASAFTPGGFDALGDHVRRNTEMFEQAMRMFLPFGGGRPEPRPAPPPAEPAAKSDDIDTLRRQLDEVQKRLDKLSSKG